MEPRLLGGCPSPDPSFPVKSKCVVPAPVTRSAVSSAAGRGGLGARRDAEVVLEGAPVGGRVVEDEVHAGSNAAILDACVLRHVGVPLASEQTKGRFRRSEPVVTALLSNSNSQMLLPVCVQGIPHRDSVALTPGRQSLPRVFPRHLTCICTPPRRKIECSIHRPPA